MTISEIKNMSREQLSFELQQGGTFVRYNYCISLVVVSLKRTSVHFVKAGESRVTRGLPFSLISLVCGWWGIPWGPIWTIQALAVNFGGGTDITAEVRRAMGPIGVVQQPVAGTTGPPLPAA